ncbi:hypothetical protein C8F04DRAFT_1189790 [Mycena alexandri]|uniref:Uncharacterized protein n=1 Tax=Mycena alexandri TaxID=1745969 RepID=A0AAD6WXR0_9AGAR|nr:hypothetical protein C8F04DRAFT_1189790 [Mycena alexandri]
MTRAWKLKEHDKITHPVTEYGPSPYPSPSKFGCIGLSTSSQKFHARLRNVDVDVGDGVDGGRCDGSESHQKPSRTSQSRAAATLALGTWPPKGLVPVFDIPQGNFPANLIFKDFPKRQLTGYLATLKSPLLAGNESPTMAHCVWGTHMMYSGVAETFYKGPRRRDPYFQLNRVGAPAVTDPRPKYVIGRREGEAFKYWSMDDIHVTLIIVDTARHWSYSLEEATGIANLRARSSSFCSNSVGFLLCKTYPELSTTFKQQNEPPKSRIPGVLVEKQAKRSLGVIKLVFSPSGSQSIRAQLRINLSLWVEIWSQVQRNKLEQSVVQYYSQHENAPSPAMKLKRPLKKRLAGKFESPFLTGATVSMEKALAPKHREHDGWWGSGGTGTMTGAGSAGNCPAGLRCG